MSEGGNRERAVALPRAGWKDGRLMAALETGLVSAYLFSTLWLIGPVIERDGMAGLTLASFAAVFFYCAYLSPKLLHEDPWEARGLGPARTLFIRTDNLLDAGRDVGAITFVAAALMLLVGWSRDPGLLAAVNWKAFLLRFAYYLVSASIQAVFFFQFFLLRLRKMVLPADGEEGLDPRDAAPRRATVACLFGLLVSLHHLPNLPLMALTLAAGVGWGWVFQKNPNLFAVAVSHAFLGTVLHKVVGLSLRIGPFYRHSEKQFLTHVVPPLSHLREIIYGP